MEIRDLCRPYTAEVVGRMVAMMRQSKDPRLSLEAMKWLMDRAWGKAPQFVGVAAAELPVEFTIKIGDGEEADGDRSVG